MRELADEIGELANTNGELANEISIYENLIIEYLRNNGTRTSKSAMELLKLGVAVQGEYWQKWLKKK